MSEQIPKTSGAHSPAVNIVLSGIDSGEITREEVLSAASRAVLDHALGLSEENETLKENAHIDGLTGLNNRDGMIKAIKEVLELPVEERENKYVLFIDLDNFKTINDTKGHAKGDTILCTVADKLKVRNGDIAGRFAGDEFVVLIDPEAEEQERRKKERAEGTSRRATDMTQEETVAGAIERLRGEIEDAGRENGEVLSASIGAVRVNGHTTVAELLDLSDAAMYKDKQRKTERLQRLSNEVNGQASEKEVVGELEALGSELDIDKLANDTPKNMMSEHGVEFAGKHWDTLDVERAGLDNFLFNIGQVMNGDTEMKPAYLRQVGLGEEKFDELFAKQYPVIAERVKTLTAERLSTENGIRDGSVSVEEQVAWRQKNIPEIELLTSYVFWKVSEQLWNDNKPGSIDLLKQ